VWALLLALACWPAANLIFCQADNTAIACGLVAGALVAGAGPRAYARLWAAAAATGGLAGLGLCAVFGAEGLAYNMFVIPAGFPFINPTGKMVHLPYLGYVLTYVAGPALLIALQARKLLQRDHPALAPSLVFACSIPFNLAGFLTIGGHINSLHGVVYLLPATALWMAARQPSLGAWSWSAPVVLAATLAVQTVVQWPLPMRPQLTGLHQW
jgi:hypothetical protein